MKYVIFDHSFPVIFQEGIGHNKITVKGMKPTSAGFISIVSKTKLRAFESYLDIKIYGESLSLNLKPSDRDLEIFERYFGEY